MNCKPIAMELISIPCNFLVKPKPVIGKNTDIILSVVAFHTSLTVRGICGGQRGRKLTDAKKMVAWLLRKYEPGLTQTHIGDLLKVHRTTIVYYCDLFRDHVVYDHEFKSTYQKISNSLKGMEASQKHAAAA